MRKISIIFIMITAALSPWALAQRKNGFNLNNTSIPVEQIKQGGTGKDGIPALLSPKFLTVNIVDYLNDKDKVIGLSLNGVQKAYPIKILNYHEIVNDNIGGSPVIISYCPLCGTGLVFNAIIDGQIRHFGVSGLLYNSDVLMYDKESNSLWSQLLMQAVSGSMNGQKLSFIESEHTTWKDWKTRYPQTKVLSNKTGYSRDYNRTPYHGYTLTPTLYFPVEHQSDLLPAKKQVLGIEVNGKFKAYSFTDLTKAGKTLQDSLNGVSYTIHFDSPNRSATVSITSGEGLTYVTSYWFAWYAFHPETAVYQPRP